MEGVLWIVRTGSPCRDLPEAFGDWNSVIRRFSAAALIEGLPAELVMADTAYDADHLRQAIAAKGALAVIPNNPSRALKHPLDKHLYAQRHVECSVPPRRNPLRKDRPKLPRRRHSRGHHVMDAISVHTT